MLAIILASLIIQERIDSSSPGSTVIVPAGIYYEHIKITKPIILIGEGKPVIDGGNKDHVVEIESPDVTIRGFVIRGSGDSMFREHSGIITTDSPRCVIETNVIEYCLFGINLRSSPDSVISRNKVTGKKLEIMRRGDGIRLYACNGCVITDNAMADSRDFIIWFSSSTKIERNYVTRSRYGLHYMESHENIFNDNRFENNQVAAAIMYSKKIQLRGNTFSFSRGVSAYGLLLKDCSDIAIEQNWFLDNTRGIFFDNCPDTVDGFCNVIRNAVAYNDVGISMQPHTRRVTFRDNAFMNNLTQVEVEGSRISDQNTWEGNYWSGFVGYDMDGDGISEIEYSPKSIYENLLGKYPELALLRYSPSVSALESAASLFPAIRSEDLLVDRAPRISPDLPQTGNAELPAGSSSFGITAAGIICAIAAAVATIQKRFP